VVIIDDRLSRLKDVKVTIYPTALALGFTATIIIQAVMGARGGGVIVVATVSVTVEVPVFIIEDVVIREGKWGGRKGDELFSGTRLR
jgi:hypothetical protein